MTQGKSLVEDMARARFFIDHGMVHDRLTGKHVSTAPVEFGEGRFDTSPALETCALLNQLHRESLSVLKDRLPADDRELVERLRRGPVWGNGEPIGSVVGEINGATMTEAADRIIAYSASRESEQ